MIIVQHSLFSISVDTSFIPSLVLACLPLWMLTVLILNAPRQLWNLVVLAVFFFAAGSALEFVLSGQRANAPLADPGNYLTLLYLIWLPWLAGSMAATQPKQGWWPMLGSGIFVLAQLATDTRFTLLSLLCAGLLMSWLVVCWRRPWRVALMHVCGAGIAVLLYFSLGQGGGVDLVGAVQTAGGGENVRTELWRATLSAIKELGGLHGTGLYTFSFIYPAYRSLEEQGTSGLFTHNDYLQLVLEGGMWMGIPLIALTLWVMAGFLRPLLSGRRRGGQVEDRAVRQLGVYGTVGLALLHSMLNFVFYSLPLLIVLALLLGMAARMACNAPLVEGLSRDGPAGKSFRGIAGSKLQALARWGIVAILSVNVCYVCLDALTLGVFSGHQRVPGADYIRDDAGRMLSYAEAAQTLNNDRVIPVLAHAAILESTMAGRPTPLLFTQIDAAYRKALEMDSWNPFVYIRYGSFLAAYAGESGAAAEGELLRRALAVNPYDLGVNAALLARYKRLGDDAGLHEVAQNVLRWCAALATQNGAAEFLQEVDVLLAGGLGNLTRTDFAHCLQRPARLSNNGRKTPWVLRWLNNG